MRQDDSIAGQDRLDTGFHGHCDQGLYDRPTTAIDQQKSRESPEAAGRKRGYIGV